jgi:hypothetical protein
MAFIVNEHSHQAAKSRGSPWAVLSHLGTLASMMAGLGIFEHLDEMDQDPSIGTHDIPSLNLAAPAIFR